MEIVKRLNVPVEYLYDTVVKSVLADIKTQTGKKIPVHKLKGYKYIKTFSKNARATIQIEDLVENRLYQYRTSTNKNDFLVIYQFKPLSGNRCELHYTEKMESHGYLQKINDAFVGIIWARLRKRRFHAMLNEIEQHYLTQQNK